MSENKVVVFIGAAFVRLLCRCLFVCLCMYACVLFSVFCFVFICFVQHVRPLGDQKMTPGPLKPDKLNRALCRNFPATVVCC